MENNKVELDLEHVVLVLEEVEEVQDAGVEECRLR